MNDVWGLLIVIFFKMYTSSDSISFYKASPVIKKIELKAKCRIRALKFNDKKVSDTYSGEKQRLPTSNPKQ